MKHTTCVDCNIKIPNTRIRCEKCWTIGFAEDTGINFEEVLKLLKTESEIKI